MADGSSPCSKGSTIGKLRCPGTQTPRLRVAFLQESVPDSQGLVGPPEAPRAGCLRTPPAPVDQASRVVAFGWRRDLDSGRPPLSRAVRRSSAAVSLAAPRPDRAGRVRCPPRPQLRGRRQPLVISRGHRLRRDGALYVLVRMLAHGFRPRPQLQSLVPLIPTRWLALAAVAMALFHVVYVATSAKPVIDVGQVSVGAPTGSFGAKDSTMNRSRSRIRTATPTAPPTICCTCRSSWLFRRCTPATTWWPREPPPLRSICSRVSGFSRSGGVCVPKALQISSVWHSPSPGSATRTRSSSRPTASTTRSSLSSL